jgi:hypothetical protein
MNKRTEKRVSSRVTGPQQRGDKALVKREAGHIQLSPSEPDRAQILERAHPTIVAGVPYAVLTTAKNDEFTALAGPAALSFVEEMCPRDGLERLALSQALLAHSRASWLTRLLAKQTEATAVNAISEASERAAITLTRLMKALREYREPRTATVSIAQVGQANLGHGQLIQNFLNQEVPKNSVKQTRISPSGAAANAKALRSIDEGAAFTPRQHPANSALDEKYRPKNPRGKSQGRRQCAKARHQKRRYHRTPKTDDGNN